MISKEDVEHIAKLARLELTEKETQKMQQDMSVILDYFDLLKKAKKPAGIKKIKPLPIEKATRKDKAQKSNIEGDLVAAAPDSKDGFFKVKAIL